MKKATAQLIGNVGQIEAQYTPQGKMVCKGTVAVNIGKGDKKETDWYSFVAWERLAEWMNESVQIGTRVLLEGNQRIQKWNSKEGESRMKVEITIQDFTVIAKGKERESHPEDENQDIPEFMRD